MTEQGPQQVTESEKKVQEILQKPMSMRQARVYLPMAFGAMLLGACSVARGEKPSRPIETRLPEGLIDPEYCSEVIRKFDLVPRQIEQDYDQPPEVLIQRSIDAGVAYLRKFRDMLGSEENPVNPLTMSQLRLTQAHGNYPIALPYPEKYTIHNFLNTFVSDLESKKTRLLAKPDYDGFLGTVSSFQPYEQGGFSRTTDIWISPHIARDRQFVTPAGNLYRSYSDAEVGFLLLHEFAHAMQEEMTMQIVNRRIETGELKISPDDTPGYTEAFMHQVAGQLEAMGKQFAKATGVPDGWRIQFNEAQANGLHLLGYFTLMQANEGRPLPGTTFIFPTEAQRKYDEADKAGTNYPLFPQFLESVIAKRDPFEKDWLMLHAIPTT